GHFEPNTLTGVLQTIEAGIVLEKYAQQMMQCPACEGNGIISGQIGVQDWEQDEAGAHPSALLFAYEFRCPTCGLHLEKDELASAGLETELDVENVEPEDFYEDEGPDDWWHG